MPFSLCCGKEVGTTEPKICIGCDKRVYNTTLKPPAGSTATGVLVDKEMIRKIGNNNNSIEGEGPILAAVHSLQELDEILKRRLMDGQPNPSLKSQPSVEETRSSTPPLPESEVSSSSPLKTSTDVEIFGLKHETQYNGLRGTIISTQHGELLIRLHPSTAMANRPWQGALGGRGNVPKHDRVLPWEDSDKHTTRQKDTYNDDVIPPISSLTVPGSLCIEKNFSPSNVRPLRKKLSQSQLSYTQSSAGGQTQSAASTANSTACGMSDFSIGTNANPSQPQRKAWEVFGIRGGKPIEAREGRELPWGSPLRKMRENTSYRSPRASNDKGGQRPYNACPLRNGTARPKEKSDEPQQQQQQQQQSLGTWERPNTTPRERRRIEALRQRLAAVEGSLVPTNSCAGSTTESINGGGYYSISRSPDRQETVQPPTLPASGSPLRDPSVSRGASVTRQSVSPPARTSQAANRSSSKPSSPSPSPDANSPVRRVHAVCYDDYDDPSFGLIEMVKRQEQSQEAAAREGGQAICSEIQQKLNEYLNKKIGS